MENIFEEKLVSFNVSLSNPIEAIENAGELLLKNGNIESDYITAMVESYKEHGSYIVIAPGLAMPHAEVRVGVKDTKVSMITLKNPIIFGHDRNDPVKIVLAIASKNTEEHLENIKRVVELLQVENIIEQMYMCKNYSELNNLIGGI